VADTERLAHVALTVNGSPLPVDLYSVLTLLSVEESVQLPDSFVVRFADPHFKLFDRMMFTIGSAIDIAFSGEQGRLVTVTHGEVTAISMEQGADGLHDLVLHGLDVTHRLAKRPKTRSFQQQTDADIASQVMGEYGLKTDIDPTFEVYEYVLQSNQTDYAFLRERADRIGFDLWISDRKFYFKPAPGSTTRPPALRWGENLHKFKVRFSSTERCDEVIVRGWDPVAKRAVIGRATQGDSGTSVTPAKEFADAARSAFGRVSRTSGRYPVATQREADNVAQSLLFKCSGDEVIAKGEAEGDPMIAAGATVAVESMGQKLSGHYRVTSVEHVYGAGSPYVTRFVCGGKEPAQLTELLSQAGGGASGSANGNGWAGLVIGTVTNVSDENSLGRVRVKFPTLGETDESAWAKVVTPGGGEKRGLQCIPEVGDEVLVGFEHNDVRRPVVIGGLWNRNDPLPDPEAVTRDGTIERRSWTSRKGHRVELSDKESEGSISLTLSDSSATLSLKRSDSRLAGEQKLTVEGADIEIKAGTRLTLKAPSIEIQADSTVKITGKPIMLN
jgi:phage protein D/phage baseplate assembly protein gpV